MVVDIVCGGAALRRLFIRAAVTKIGTEVLVCEVTLDFLSTVPSAGKRRRRLSSPWFQWGNLDGTAVTARDKERSLGRERDRTVQHPSWEVHAAQKIRLLGRENVARKIWLRSRPLKIKIGMNTERCTLWLM